MSALRAGFVQNALANTAQSLAARDPGCGSDLPQICDAPQVQCLAPVNIPRTTLAANATVPIQVVPLGGRCAAVAIQLIIAAATFDLVSATISTRNWLAGGPINADAYIAGATRDPLPFPTGAFDRNNPLIITVTNLTGGTPVFGGVLWCNAVF